MNPKDNNNQWLVSSDIFLTLVEFLSKREITLPDQLTHQFESIQKHNNAELSFIPAALLGEAFQFAEDALDDTLIALRCGASSETKHWGFLGYLIQTSQTTGEALATLDQYSKLITNQYQVCIHQGPGEPWIEGKTVNGEFDQYSRHFIEYIISSFLSFVRQWTTLELPCESFQLPWKAENTAENYQALLGAPCYFEEERLQINLSIDTLKYSLQHCDPKLHQLMLEKTTELYQHVVMQDDWLLELKKYILDNLSQGTPSLANASAHLDLGERTLRRKLEKIGLSYQGLIDDTRKEIAIPMVKEAKLSLMEISLLLGFSEQSSFHRAFKRWTGKTPLKY